MSNKSRTLLRLMNLENRTVPAALVANPNIAADFAVAEVAATATITKPNSLLKQELEKSSATIQRELNGPHSGYTLFPVRPLPTRPTVGTQLDPRPRPIFAADE